MDINRIKAYKVIYVWGRRILVLIIITLLRNCRYQSNVYN
jgi:hypothetical protein